MTKLAVLEAYTRDVGCGVARIGSNMMQEMELAKGDVIEIKGKRRTVAKCLAGIPPEQDSDHTQLAQSHANRIISHVVEISNLDLVEDAKTKFDGSDNTSGYQMKPIDLGKFIRIDGIIRNNAGIAIGDTVSIRKIIASQAEKITVMALESIPPMDERYLADALESIPVTKGDNVMVPYFGGRLTFQIMDISPDVEAVTVSQKTIFNISNMRPTLQADNNFAKLPKQKLVEAYEKELLEKQEEIKNTIRSMLKQNHLPEDIEKSLNSSLRKDLFSIYQKLVNAYREYVKGFEEEMRRK